MNVEPVLQSLARAPDVAIPPICQAAPILKLRPPSGTWSIHEHGCHLAEVHGLMSARLDRMLAEDRPRIASYDPGRDEPDARLLALDLDEALDRYAHDRQLVVRLRGLGPADWQRTARHDEYNSYSVFAMYRHLALHDFFHAYRIEELVLRRDWPAPRP